jgi:hypothetical protein
MPDFSQLPLKIPLSIKSHTCDSKIIWKKKAVPSSSSPFLRDSLCEQFPQKHFIGATFPLGGTDGVK